ncbi:MAG: RES family NAD+ phosphorylase [Myxococcales bacterium]
MGPPIRSAPLEGRFHRVVEAQFRNSTRQLVDSDEEQGLLEELLDARAKAPVPEGFADLHYLLSTPFRHPPLRNGTRFGTRHERGILYGSAALATALAEVAYYRLLFLAGPREDLGPVRVPLTAFAFGIRARRAVDLSRAPFARLQAQISSRVSYARSQPLGARLRGAGIQACLYVSARARPAALNLAVFDNVFAPKKPTGEESFRCTADRGRVEFRAQSLIGAERRFVFARAQFLVDGRLPSPALSGASEAGASRGSGRPRAPPRRAGPR